MSTPMIFDARQYTPQQGMPAHPPGKFRAMIIDSGKRTAKDNPNSGMFWVTFRTDAGQIEKRYNLWNPTEKACEIARNELSALCYATGIFNVDLAQDGIQLRNAQLMIDVTPQGGDSKYNEVSKVYDLQGNEPGKAPQGQMLAAPPAPPAPLAPPQPGYAPPQPGYAPPAVAPNGFATAPPGTYAAPPAYAPPAPPPAQVQQFQPPAYQPPPAPPAPAQYAPPASGAPKAPWG